MTLCSHCKRGPVKPGRQWCESCLAGDFRRGGCAICGLPRAYSSAAYCATHFDVMVEYGAAIARHAFLNDFEDVLIRRGKERTFDTVYVIKLIGYEPARTKFGITFSGRRGWRLAEHGDTFGALDVLLYERTPYAVEIENELKRRFASFTVGRAKELLAVVDADEVARTTRELLALPFGALGFARTPLGIYVPEKRILAAESMGISLIGKDYLKGAPLAAAFDRKEIAA